LKPNNTISAKELWTKSVNLLTIYDSQERDSILNFYFHEKWNISKSSLLFDQFISWSNEQNQELLLDIKRLENAEPVQHIVGHTYFLNSKINVNHHVLIPRPETEEMVYKIQQAKFPSSIHSILDVCTGSGCIAIELQKHFKEAQVTGIDISTEALEVAKANNESNQTKVNFIQDNFLEPKYPFEMYDLIVSNPPYIPASEKVEMHSNVLQYEPHLALFVPDDNVLLFYKKLVDLADKHLNNEGWLYAEIHYLQRKAVLDLCSQYSFSKVIIEKDIFDRDRFLLLTK
jgi:release factor glutamine methyltransferase